MTKGPTYFKNIKKWCPISPGIDTPISAPKEGKFYTQVNQEVKWVNFYIHFSFVLLEVDILSIFTLAFLILSYLLHVSVFFSH